LLLVKRSIFTKILISLLVATIIPFILSNIISYQITGKAINKQLVELNQNSMAITTSSIHNYFHDLSLLGLSYYSNPALTRILASEEIQTPAESVYITQQLEHIYAGYTEIGTVSYKSALTNKQFNSSSNYNSRVIIPDFHNQTLSSPHDELKSDFQVTRVGNELRLRVNRYFIDISTRDIIGLTTFDVEDTKLRDIVGALTTSQDGTVYVFIQDNLQLLYSAPGNNKDNMGWMDALYDETNGKTGSVKGSIHKPEGTYIYYRDVSYQLPVTLVKFIPKSLINEARTTALGQSITLQMGAVLLVGLMAAFISYFILRRVVRILQHIKKVQMGDFNINAPKRAKAPDELDLLEERFHAMTTELDELWNKQYRHQLELSHARLKMLQAQINPHFFYNTLQSIGTLAIKNNVRDVSDRIAEFGAIFRYNMDIDTEEVYLKEELDHVEHYTSLQMSRYKNKLTYSAACPDEAYLTTMPKMIVQPLVENSIVHGLEKGTGSVDIKVEIERRETAVFIHIIDNGKGFTPEEIQNVHNRYQDKNTIDEVRHGIGLKNVLKRLHLYYGDSFEWSISSEPYQQTKITLKIPTTIENKEFNRDESTDRR